MKKVFLTIVACAFSFVGAYAQNSDVERANQLTKAEQFKANNSFVKESTIYTDKNSGLKLFAKLFTIFLFLFGNFSTPIMVIMRTNNF